MYPAFSSMSANLSAKTFTFMAVANMRASLSLRNSHSFIFGTKKEFGTRDNKTSALAFAFGYSLPASNPEFTRSMHGALRQHHGGHREPCGLLWRKTMCPSFVSFGKSLIADALGRQCPRQRSKVFSLIMSSHTRFTCACQLVSTTPQVSIPAMLCSRLRKISVRMY